METKNIKLKPFLIILILIIFFEQFFAFILKSQNINEYYKLTILGLVRILDILIIIYCFNRWGKGTNNIFFYPSKIFIGIYRGLLWSLGFGVIVLFSFGVLILLDYNHYL